MEKMLLFCWPWSQHAMELDSAILVNPEHIDKNGEEHYDTYLDSAYLIPETDAEKLPAAVVENCEGVYIKVDFPDSLAHDEDEEVLYDYESDACYVPIEN